MLKIIYNISPLHPLAKYPGPLLWRASRLPASWHHAKGTLYQQVSAFHAQYGPTIRLAPDELSFTSPEAWPQIYNSRPQLQKSIYHFPPGDPERLPESMITAPDADHARLRRLAGPAFLNSSILEVEPVIQRYADLLCSQLKESSENGESQNVVDWFLWTLNDVIGQLSLNQEFQCLEKKRLHPWPSFLMGSLKQVAAVNQWRRFGMSLKALNALMTQDMMDRRDNFLETAKTSLDARLAQEDEVNSNANSKKRRPDIVGLMLREMKGGEKLDFKELQSNAMLIVGSEHRQSLLYTGR